MKVPRIALGVAIKCPEPCKKYEGAVIITHIDLPGKRFCVNLKGIAQPAIDYAEGLIGQQWEPLDSYDPLPTWENFILAIDQYDYYYNMSDSPAVITEGKEMADALKRLFKELPKDDQHRLQKIVDIVVNV